MANSETGDGQAAGGGRGRSASRSRRLVEPNAANNGEDSTEALKESVAELQTQFRQVQQQLQAVTEVLQRQALPPASPASPATEGQTGDGEAGAGPATEPNPSSKVTLAPPAASSADASIADTDEAASWIGSEAAGDDIDGILVAVGQPDPRRKHDPQCDGLSENWRELLKEGPSDQSIPLRCGNGLTHLIRPAGEALRLIERLLPATEEPEAQAELDRLATDLRKGLQAAYSPLAFIQIQRTKGAAAADAISQIATQSEAHYSALGGIPLAGKLANYVTKFQEDVAKKRFKDLSKSSDKSSGGGSSGGGKGNGKLLTQASRRRLCATSHGSPSRGSRKSRSTPTSRRSTRPTATWAIASLRRATNCACCGKVTPSWRAKTRIQWPAFPCRRWPLTKFSTWEH